MNQNRVTIEEALKQHEAQTQGETPREEPALSPSDRLWMALYSKMGELCVDPRPAIRKSAGQTLFSTISAHGSLLEKQTWYTVLWQVRNLFLRPPPLPRVIFDHLTETHKMETK